MNRPSLILFLGCTLYASVVAADPRIGVVLSTKGHVSVRSASGASRSVARRAPLFQGDTLITGADGQLQARLDDGSMLGLNENSKLEIKHFDNTSSKKAGFQAHLQGGLHTLTGAVAKANPDHYEVKTPVATIGVRGTHYRADYRPGESLKVAVLSGHVEVQHGEELIELDALSNIAAAALSEAGTVQLARTAGLADSPQSTVARPTPRSNQSEDDIDEDEDEDEDSEEVEGIDADGADFADDGADFGDDMDYEYEDDSYEYEDDSAYDSEDYYPEDALP